MPAFALERPFVAYEGRLPQVKVCLLHLRESQPAIAPGVCGKSTSEPRESMATRVPRDSSYEMAGGRRTVRARSDDLFNAAKQLAWRPPRPFETPPLSGTRREGQTIVQPRRSARLCWKCTPPAFTPAFTLI